MTAATALLCILVLQVIYFAENRSLYDFTEEREALLSFERMRRGAPVVQKKVGDKQMSVQQTCMFAHNKARALHKDTPNLKWDPKLAASAEKWAVQIAGMGSLQHSDTSKIGENLAFKSFAIPEDIVYTPADAVWMWYQESVDSNYDYSRPGLQQAGLTSHFTQLVWKSTKRVGCGVATVHVGGQYKTFIVAQYEPKGNMQDEFLKNVLPMKPGGKAPANSLELEKQGACIDKSKACGTQKDNCQQKFMQETCTKTCNC